MNTRAQPAAADPSQRRDRAKRPLRSLVEWVAVVVGALVVALVVKTFLFQAFYIPSASMAPTLVEDDRVMVNKLSYDVGDINRGDIVVFERPSDTPPSEANDHIKRVTGLAGETIGAEEGQITIDGVPLAGPYLPPSTSTGSFGPVEVPEGHLFVMGDNRNNSGDSRVFGPIPSELVVGRAFVQVWPLDDLSTL